MRKLGVSIYTDQAPLKDINSYLTTAHQYGFSRIFTCLISLEGEAFSDFKSMCAHAKSLGMEVIADVDPSVFTQNHLTPHDLGYFVELGLSGIRLDLGFSGIEEAQMSNNPYGLMIELNMSNGTRYIDNILSHQPNVSKIIGCHNFYPHRYTGLSRSHFEKCSKQFKDLGLRTAAFVSSHVAQFGPWPVSEGLCTLEAHRELPIETQAKDLYNTQWIDDVIIGNMFASEEELKALGALNRDVLTLKIKIEATASALERKILLEEPHFNRGDVSDYLIRSTQSRVKYKGQGFPLTHAPTIQKGHVLIESDLYTRYAGELQIARLPMENSGKTNVVATIDPSETYLLDAIRPWQTFKFVEAKE